jgi:hypothetical protein
MFAMPEARAFSLAPSRHSGGVAFDEDGVFVGGVLLLKREQTPFGVTQWTVRPLDALDAELTAVYRLPIDVARKADALSRIATALNRGDRATAAIAAVLMEFPDPPPLAKGAESRAELERRAHELHVSGLLKFRDPTHRELGKDGYDPNEPRVPAGHREGGQWTKGDWGVASNVAATVLSDATPDNIWRPGAQYAANEPPPGIGHNQGPPLDDPPEIPPRLPLRARLINDFLKATAYWLATAYQTTPRSSGFTMPCVRRVGWRTTIFLMSLPIWTRQNHGTSCSRMR